MKLTLEGEDFPAWLCEKATQTLEFVPRNVLRRTLGGQLIALGKEEGKYKSTLKIQGPIPMALQNMGVGHVLKVSCLAYLWQKADQTQVSLKRPAVEHSVIVLTENKERRSIVRHEGGVVILENALGEALHVGYRPQLTMMVAGAQSVIKEGESVYSLMLEEV